MIFRGLGIFGFYMYFQGIAKGALAVLSCLRDDVSIGMILIQSF